MEITGTTGSYIMDAQTWEIITHRRGATVRTSGANPASEHGRYYRNVANHLAGGEKLIITGQWSRRPIHILDLAVRSAKQNRALKAKYR